MLPIIGRERALLDELSKALQALVGGPPPSKKTLAEVRRHNSERPWPTDFGNVFEVQIVDPDGEPTGHIARVTIELERFEPTTAPGAVGMSVLGHCQKCGKPVAEGQPRYWVDDDGYLCGSCAIDFLVHERNAALTRAEGGVGALRTLMEFGQKLCASENEDERLIGACICEGARIVDDLRTGGSTTMRDREHQWCPRCGTFDGVRVEDGVRETCHVDGVISRVEWLVPRDRFVRAVAICDAAEKVSEAWDRLVEFDDFDHVAEAIEKLRATLAARGQ